MTSLLNSLKSLTLLRKLAFAYELAEPTFHRHKGKLIEVIKEKAQQASNSEIARKMRVAKGFYTLEVAPPKSNEMKQIMEDVSLVNKFIKEKCFLHLTVRQAWLLFLVCLEVSLWFFLGETIGKFHIIGYKVDSS